MHFLKSVRKNIRENAALLVLLLLILFPNFWLAIPKAIFPALF